MGVNKFEGSVMTKSSSKTNLIGVANSAARSDNKAYLGSPVRSTTLNNSGMNMSAKVENPLVTNKFEFAEKSISQ